MASLIFILAVTGISILISYMISADGSWFDYYKGGIIGFFISGIILYVINSMRRAKELKKDNRK